MQSVEDLCDEISFISNPDAIITKPISAFKEEYRMEFRYEVIFRGNEIDFFDALIPGFDVESVENKEGNNIAVIKPNLDIDPDINMQTSLLSALSKKVLILSFKRREVSLDQIFIEISKMSKSKSQTQLY